MRFAACRYAVLLHPLQQRRLRLGCGAVDLVGQHQIGEDRPALELHRLPAGLVLAHHRAADNVPRHQIRGELDARELEMEHVRQRLHQLGLADAGNTLEQNVPTCEQTSHDPDDVLVVADDDVRHLLAHDSKVVAKLLNLAFYGYSAHWAPSRRFMK